MKIREKGSTAFIVICSVHYTLYNSVKNLTFEFYSFSLSLVKKEEKMPEVQSENWVNISETNLDKKKDASGNDNSKSNATPADDVIDAHKSSVYESPEEKKSPHIKDFNDMLQAVGSWGR